MAHSALPLFGREENVAAEVKFQRAGRVRAEGACVELADNIIICQLI